MIKEVTHEHFNDGNISEKNPESSIHKQYNNFIQNMYYRNGLLTKQKWVILVTNHEKIRISKSNIYRQKLRKMEDIYTYYSTVHTTTKVT